MSEYLTLQEAIDEKGSQWLWLFTNTIPSAVQTEITDYLKYRRVNSTNLDRFHSYFVRTVLAKQEKFKELLDTEALNFNASIETDITDSSTGTDTIVRDNVHTTAGTDTTSTNASNITNRDLSTESTDSNTDSAEESNMGINSAYPQSNISQTGIPDPDSVSWNYATSSAGNKKTNSSSSAGTNSTTDTGQISDDSSTSGTLNTSNTLTYDDNETHTVSSSNTKSGHTTDLPTLYIKYREFVRGSQAFEYIIDCLQPCFLSVFDFEEDI